MRRIPACSYVMTPAAELMKMSVGEIRTEFHFMVMVRVVRRIFRLVRHGAEPVIEAFVALPEKSGMKKPSKFKAFLKLLGFLCVEAMGLEPMSSRV